MVATVSQTIANANNDEKKRTHPIDRARAIHLSRQLQMRLQYAKLKVEHGWTKQRLNEVENLYFHLSHARGGKAPTSSSANLTTTTTTTITRDSSAHYLHDTPSPAPTQSVLSFKSTLSRQPTLPADDMEMPTAGPSALPDLPSISFVSFTPPPSVSPLQPSPFPPDSLPFPSKPVRVTPPPHANGPPPEPLKTQMKPWPSPTLTPKHPPVLKQSGTAPGGQTSLTYDSFWSTHSAGRTSRSFGSFSSRGSMGDIAAGLTTDVG